MRSFIVSVTLLIAITLVITYSNGFLKIYEPSHDSINITISEVKTGNKLIEISELNVILLAMVVGVFLFCK